MTAQVKGRVTTPTVRITGPRFQYVRSEHTNLAKTFERAKAELRRQK